MSKNILLTGAGFTHNFGTPLASGMWAAIFNHPKVQKQKNVREKMLNDFDYESIYYKIVNNGGMHKGFADLFEGTDTRSADIDAIIAAVRKAYEDMDQKILEVSTLPISIGGINKLIGQFKPEKGECSFFTLNQDLLIERTFDLPTNCYCGDISYPGIGKTIGLIRKLPQSVDM